jgi:hypothetical protein
MVGRALFPFNEKYDGDENADNDKDGSASTFEGGNDGGAVRAVSDSPSHVTPSKAISRKEESEAHGICQLSSCCSERSQTNTRQQQGQCCHYYKGRV